MKIARKHIRKPRVEMIPLIDVVFLILVFFIYSFISMTVHRGLSVALPQATAAVVDKQDYVSITIFDDNTIACNKETVDMKELNAKLDAFLAKDPQTRFYINGDKQASHGVVVSIIDMLRMKGIEKIHLETTHGGGYE